MEYQEGSGCTCGSEDEHEQMILRIEQSQRKDATGERAQYAMKVSTSEALRVRARTARAQLNGHD